MKHLVVALNDPALSLALHIKKRALDFKLCKNAKLVLEFKQFALGRFIYDIYENPSSSLFGVLKTIFIISSSTYLLYKLSVIEILLVIALLLAINL
ncbi:MAG: hypothetical protein LBQ52_02015 [Helicobacteraceae bacterium]|jgi:hypothetical protein|nr:hypothetical protein [Helicobacteraceae bacterium]